jgi:cytochrome c553
LVAGFVLLVAFPISAYADAPTGEQVYKQKCASCHGAKGEGTDDNYPQQLEGDRSVAQLTKYIAKSMPKEGPKCTADEAEKVAAYIYEAFYSKLAQARNRPPRIDLSRLTVRQYRNAIADLVGTFRTPGVWGDQRGLKAEYFKSRDLGGRDRLIERVDSQVSFDFGTSGPEARFDEEQFSIRWTGAVLAPETGTYEFVVRTENGTKLWVNDSKNPLIDAWVKSGNDTEYRGSIYLLGGRVYPLRLEFSKAKVGVDDTKTRKVKPPPARASIVLLWKVPGQSLDVVPSRCLTPAAFPALFAVQTPFPPDDRSIGYERGTSVSKAWDKATTDAALEVTGYVSANLRELADLGFHGNDRATKLRTFCLRFAERAFRRPLNAEQKTFFVERYLNGTKDLDLAVKRVLLLVLKSPRFLYRELDPMPDAFDVACRISFGLWDSLPDKELLDAAAAGQLATHEQVTRQATRMLADLRARSKVREFLHQWLKVDANPDIARDPRQFPGFDQAVVSDLRTSLDLFLDDVVWSKASDFRQFFLANTLYLNGRLAGFYGEDLPANSDFQNVVPREGERAGILSHPYLLTCFSYTATTSPIHRGVFIARNLMGQSPRPPPQAFVPLPVESHPGLTTRERVALQTRPGACQTCHSVINPLGYPLEHFDAVGRYRDAEVGRTIDSSGGYQTAVGDWIKFNGVKDLATYLVSSERTRDTFVEQLFHSLIKQPVRAFGPEEVSALGRAFAEYDFNIQKLIVKIIADSARTPRKEKP